MSRTMGMLQLNAKSRADSVLVALHSDRDADPASWSEWIALIEKCSSEVKGDLIRIPTLVLTDGGLPTSAQRSQATSVIANGTSTPSMSILTESTTVRVTIRALSIFNLGMKVFAPNEFIEALARLQIAKEDANGCLEALEKEAKRVFGPGGLRTINAIRASLPK